MEPNFGQILIVDDEQDILEIIDYNLKKAGYTTETAKNGHEAIQKAMALPPDLILLDVMMPGKNGHQTLKSLRQKKELDATIIIFLTALADEKSEIEGLKLGADDYISKPIKMDLLLARLKTALRRKRKDEEAEDKMIFGDIEINKSQFKVFKGEEEVILAKKEFELLSLFASKPGRVFLRTEILESVWGGDVIVGDRTIDVHVRKIRQKIGLDIITTVKGVGYKFEMTD